MFKLIAACALVAVAARLDTTNLGLLEQPQSRDPTRPLKLLFSWYELSSSVAAAIGTDVVLTLSIPFDMAGFTKGSAITIPDKTSITIVGNGAEFKGFCAAPWANCDRYFIVSESTSLIMFNVSVLAGSKNECENGNGIMINGGHVELTSCTLAYDDADGNGGAISVEGGGSVILRSCLFDSNVVYQQCSGNGGAIYLRDSTAVITDCTFQKNQATQNGALVVGGAIFVDTNASAVLQGCSFVGPISKGKNDIARADGGSVTFKCPVGSSGPDVHMQDSDITVIPPAALVCS
jgi:hypothetical protein